MAKFVKRFRPKYVKRLRDRPSGIGQTGAHAGSQYYAPPDIHRLGWAPRPFPRSGLTGQPNSSIMGAMGTGQLSYYTDEDKEEFARQSGPPGKGGNYKRSMRRFYMNKGGGKAMIGLPAGVLGEAELREVIRGILVQLNEDPEGRKAFNYEILTSQEEIEEEDEDDVEEASISANVAGYTLPLGASNHPSTLKSRGEFTARMYGGKPVRTIKLQRMKKPE